MRRIASRRAATAGLATVAIALASSSLATSGAHSAPPTGDCATPYPTGGLTAGQPVAGLTVSKGTTPDPFTGEVLGVLQDGIAPGLDMIMMRLTSPEIDRVGGIWAGMSGSPVYADDGRLIGAVSYGLSFGPSPVAGVTPFEDMDDYLGSVPAKVTLGKGMAAKIAAGTEVTQRQAAQGLSQLPMSIGVSGVSSARLTKALTKTYQLKSGYAMGAPRSAAAGPGAESIVAGGNLAASVAYGDVTFGGVGTATSVCGNKVVGFGHPMTFAGRTTAAMHPADAIYIQEDVTLTPYKVANFGAPVGAIFEDRIAAITGTVGPVPSGMRVTSTVSNDGRSRTGSTTVPVEEYESDATFMQLLANHDRVLDRYGAGSELQSWTIAGRGPTGSPFTLKLADRYTSRYDIAYEAPWDIVEQVWSIGSIEGVSINAVTVNGAVDDSTATFTVKKVEQWRGGEWVKVSRKQPVEAKAGKKVRIRAKLGDDTTTAYAPLVIKVPRKAAGSRSNMFIYGGNGYYGGEEDYYYEEGPSSLRELLKGYRSAIRNDEVVAEVAFPVGPKAKEKQVKSDPADRVVSGFKRIKIRVN